MILRPYKKIKELELIIEDLKRKSIEYKEREEERILKEKREKSGFHNADISCMGCKNFINTGWAFICKKDSKCEDREEE